MPEVEHSAGEGERQARTAAAAFRSENGLGVAPVGDLVALIEQSIRVDVTVLPIDDGDEHGLTMVDPQRGVTIVAVPCSDHPMRWRSNLAHELGHLVFNDHQTGQPGAPSVDLQAEQRAQSFARHLLIPIEGIEHFLGRPAERVIDRPTNPISLSTLSDLVQRFQVSPAVAAIQLRGMGVIDQATYADWSAWHTPALAARFGWTDQYTALQAESRQHRAPQRLLARAVAGYIAGVASLETVASIRGITPEDLAAEFAAAGINPSPVVPGPNEDDLFARADQPVDLSWLDDE